MLGIKSGHFRWQHHILHVQSNITLSGNFRFFTYFLLSSKENNFLSEISLKLGGRVPQIAVFEMLNYS